MWSVNITLTSHTYFAVCLWHICKDSLQLLSCSLNISQYNNNWKYPFFHIFWHFSIVPGYHSVIFPNGDKNSLQYQHFETTSRIKKRKSPVFGFFFSKIYHIHIFHKSKCIQAKWFPPLPEYSWPVCGEAADLVSHICGRKGETCWLIASVTRCNRISPLLWAAAQAWLKNT